MSKQSVKCFFERTFDNVIRVKIESSISNTNEFYQVLNKVLTVWITANMSEVEVKPVTGASNGARYRIK